MSLLQSTDEETEIQKVKKPLSPTVSKDLAGVPILVQTWIGDH